MNSAPGRLFTASFVLLALSDLAYFTAIGVSFHALPLYVTGPIGEGETGAGAAFGAFALTALVCRPFAGRLSDTRGRAPLLFGGAVLCAVGMVLLPFVDTLAAVVAIRLVQGVAEAAFFVAGFALLADLAPPDRLGEALSYNSLGLYLGIAVGPPIGEFLEESRGFDVAWFAAAGLGLLAGGLVLGIRAPKVATGSSGHGKLIHRPGVRIGIGFCTSLVAIGGFLALATLHAEDIGVSDTSLALVAYGVTVVVIRIAFARTADRLAALPVATLSLVGLGVALATMAILRTPTGLILGAVLLGVGVAFSTPAFFRAVFATATPSERGAAAGTASMFLDLGLGLGPIALGSLAGVAGIPWAFAVGAAVAGLGAVWTWTCQSPRAQMSSASMIR
jgi:MFS family permease